MTAPFHSTVIGLASLGSAALRVRTAHGLLWLQPPYCIAVGDRIVVRELYVRDDGQMELEMVRPATLAEKLAVVAVVAFSVGVWAYLIWRAIHGFGRVG